MEITSKEYKGVRIGRCLWECGDGGYESGGGSGDGMGG